MGIERRIRTKGWGWWKKYYLRRSHNTWLRVRDRSELVSRLMLDMSDRIIQRAYEADRPAFNADKFDTAKWAIRASQRISRVLKANKI